MNLAAARHRPARRATGPLPARPACWASVAALLFFGWLRTRGRARPARVAAQRRLLRRPGATRSSTARGRCPAASSAIERFESHGGTYMYQGPWPALLRVPDRRGDASASTAASRLLSMLLGVVVAAAATTRLHWRVRRLARPSGPAADRPTSWLAGAVTFVVGAGSALLFEASRPWVYHEAALWGAAWSIVGHRRRRRLRAAPHAGPLRCGRRSPPRSRWPPAARSASGRRRRPRRSWPAATC